MKQKKFKNIANKVERKKAKKDYYKLRRTKKKHQDLIKDKKRREIRKKHLVLIKKNLKKIEVNLKEKSPNLSDLEKLFSQTQKSLDKAAQKGVIHKNKAANKKRKNRKKINELIKQKNLNNLV